MLSSPQNSFESLLRNFQSSQKSSSNILFYVVSALVCSTLITKIKNVIPNAPLMDLLTTHRTIYVPNGPNLITFDNKMLLFSTRYPKSEEELEYSSSVRSFLLEVSNPGRLRGIFESHRQVNRGLSALQIIPFIKFELFKEHNPQPSFHKEQP